MFKDEVWKRHFVLELGIMIPLELKVQKDEDESISGVSGIMVDDFYFGYHVLYFSFLW